MSYLDRFHTDEGLAVFSRFPILQSSHLVLSRVLSDSDDAHQRLVMRYLIETPQGHINVFHSHFALTETARQRAVLELWNWVQQFPLPHVFMGDLNAEPNDPAITFLLGESEIDGIRADYEDAFSQSQVPQSDAFTFPAWEPIKRIDFMFLRGARAANYHRLGRIPVELNQIDGNGNPLLLWSSDHFGIACDLTW